MTIELQGTKFINVEIFERFLKDNLKKYYPESFSLYLEELDDGNSATSNTDYELDSFDTVSGCPELISFEVEYFTEDDGDSWDKVITF